MFERPAGQRPVLDRPRRLRLVAGGPNEGLAELALLLEAGQLVPVIDESFQLDEVPEALRYFGEGRHKGKVATTIGGWLSVSAQCRSLSLSAESLIASSGQRRRVRPVKLVRMGSVPRDNRMPVAPRKPLVCEAQTREAARGGPLRPCADTLSCRP